VINPFNFDQSDIRWVTKNEESHGSFKVDALLRLRLYGLGLATQFVFGAHVSAGHIYSMGACAKPRLSCTNQR
jgi:hypothetical protein